MRDYSKAIIYKIECKITNDVYYGSTTESLSERIRKHKSCRDCTAINIIDRGNFTCTIIEEYPCNSKTELEAREGYYIKNNICVNRLIPGRTPQEYYQDNKDKIIVQQKERYQNNKVYILQHNKEYREKTKAYLKKYYLTKIKCECGCEVTRSNLARHIKSKKHEIYLTTLTHSLIVRKYQ